MPETPVTRETLLAAVLELRPGDVLVLRAAADVDLSAAQAGRLRELLAAQLPTGVHSLVLGRGMTVEAYRPIDAAGRDAAFVAA